MLSIDSAGRLRRAPALVLRTLTLHFVDYPHSLATLVCCSL